MRERLLRQSVCLHSQSPPQKLCVDDESLDSLVLVRIGAAIAEGASQPRRQDSYVNCCKHFQKSLRISMVVKETTCYQRIKNWHHLVEGVLEDLLAETTFHYGFA